MTRMRLIHPSTTEQNLSTPVGDEQPFRCYTLSASTGKGETKKHFYAKGCTTETSDPCSGWAKEKGGASCSLCTGNNCNAPVPTEIALGSGEGKQKASSSSVSDPFASTIWMLVAAGWGSSYAKVLV
uniref:Uncharacterized protein n=1 Tax=Anopheles farauti TaxID=69004 RepID=A0A182QZX7_9DIPT